MGNTIATNASEENVTSLLLMTYHNLKRTAIVEDGIQFIKDT